MIEIVPVKRMPQSSYGAVPTAKEPISTALNFSSHFEYSTKNVNNIIIEMAFMMTLVEIVTVSSELVKLVQTITKIKIILNHFLHRNSSDKKT